MPSDSVEKVEKIGFRLLSVVCAVVFLHFANPNSPPDHGYHMYVVGIWIAGLVHYEYHKWERDAEKALERKRNGDFD